MQAWNIMTFWSVENITTLHNDVSKQQISDDDKNTHK